MSESQTNGYLTCNKCNSLNRVNEIDQQGVYNCGSCKNPIMVVNKEKKSSTWMPLLVISVLVGAAGGFGIDKIQDMLKPTDISYSELNTTWTEQQIRHFEMKCKANYSTNKPNWSPEKIAKTCTCYVSFIVENTFFPKWGKLSESVVNVGIKECR